MSPASETRDESGSSDSSSGSESSSESESSKAKKKRLKKEKRLLKKLKKKEKKARKREKKLAKKEKKRAKKEKELKRSKRETARKSSADRSSSSDGRVAKRRAEVAAPHKRKRSKSRSRGSSSGRGGPPLAPAVRKYTPFKVCLLDICEEAARGVKSSGATIEDEEVSVYGPDEKMIDRPEAFKTFKEIREFPREIQAALQNAGFPGPSQIQALCWPLGLRGKDIIGIAATGSGKTLAFLMPAFVEMHGEGLRPERDGPGLLVMSPTRELAQQTEFEGNKFGQALRMRCVAMYGGAPKGGQMSAYRQGCACIVACPGRLNDFLEGRQVQLKSTRRLVLDEADRMLDMGFEPQIRKILAHLPSKRHTLFFTATWPREVRALASEILRKPYKVMIGNRDELKGNADVTQLTRITSPQMKVNLLGEILIEAGLASRGGLGKALIFCGTKRVCDQLSNNLERSGVPCAAIHGDKDQQQRDSALNDLKQGRIKVLVCTDVAARGLDIKGVGLVVNFDPANNAEDYVHRIGRTGRAGAKGVAMTFLTAEDGNKARSIVEVMERTGQEAPPELHQLAATAGMGKGGGGRKGSGKGGVGAMMALGSI
mmetsp:Transcript_55358/g.154178  ORF Transcript_55358/g.154178 Transcript_55358/m.154178 type:complete len:599 (-) Transcript_55358:657-2453(-)|eukprot:CAMPEP_0117506602 /NCGR_PEP_ID=MMETSP0784-20121206/25993_1 /TAXON_ID=39447 /ORGANISM="" /LENGTH=598 /DNA_ID=CAMNT_0005302081 /DNA_START=36 /DNA_END=1832 /DNA_ORIENTATION=-